MPDLYETYIRTADGETYHPTDIREGIADFLGPTGYRISFNIDGVLIVLRRDMGPDPEQAFLDKHLNTDTVNCAVTIKNHKKLE